MGKKFCGLGHPRKYNERNIFNNEKLEKKKILERTNYQCTCSLLKLSFHEQATAAGLLQFLSVDPKNLLVSWTVHHTVC